jgi:predicted transposase YbfD/YdcC
VLAHLDCNEKSYEIPAVQTLLGSLALTGSVVTVDAMHCQKKPYVDGSRLAMPLCY